MSIVTQLALAEAESAVQRIRETVQWAHRNPYQCNLPLHQERLRDAIVRRDELNKQNEREKAQEEQA